MMERSLCWLCGHCSVEERPLGGEVDPRGAWRGTLTMSKDGCPKMEAQSWVSQQRSSVGRTRWRDGLARGTIIAHALVPVGCQHVLHTATVIVVRAHAC